MPSVQVNHPHSFCLHKALPMPAHMADCWIANQTMSVTDRRFFFMALAGMTLCCLMTP